MTFLWFCSGVWGGYLRDPRPILLCVTLCSKTVKVLSIIISKDSKINIDAKFNINLWFKKNRKNHNKLTWSVTSSFHSNRSNNPSNKIPAIIPNIIARVSVSSPPASPPVQAVKKRNKCSSYLRKLFLICKKIICWDVVSGMF